MYHLDNLHLRIHVQTFLFLLLFIQLSSNRAIFQTRAHMYLVHLNAGTDLNSVFSPNVILYTKLFINFIESLNIEKQAEASKQADEQKDKYKSFLGLTQSKHRTTAVTRFN